MSASMEAWAQRVRKQLAPLAPRPVVVDLPHGPQACCCNDPIPGVAAPMNCEYGIQSCGDCNLYDSDLLAAWALSQAVPGSVVVFIRWTGDEDQPEGPIVRGWTPETDSSADVIATGTDPWVELNGEAVDWYQSNVWTGKIITTADARA